MAEAHRPVRVKLVQQSDHAVQPTLAQWLSQDQTYGALLGATARDGGQALGDLVLAGVLAPSALLGLFRLLRAGGSQTAPWEVGRLAIRSRQSCRAVIRWSV